jgi:hypothetical protein
LGAGVSRIDTAWQEAISKGYPSVPAPPAPKPKPVPHIEIPSGYPTAAFVVDAVSKLFDIPVIDILSKRKTAKVVLPRQVACYLARETTLQSLPEIGRAIGGRDHTTVLYAWRKITKLIESDNELRGKVNLLRAKLEGVRG